MRHILLTLAFFCCITVFAQHDFPQGHYCNTSEGWDCKSCRALHGMKKDDPHEVIVIPHRGIWGSNDIPEGSIASLEEGYNQNYMFIEIDLVLTADKRLVLCHDQQTNRMTTLPETFSADGNLNDNGSFFRNLKFSSSVENTVPDPVANYYQSFPAVNTSYYKDRYNEPTNKRINTFEDVIEFIKDKPDVVVTIDIKTGSFSDPAVKVEYMEAISLCLALAKTPEVLAKLIFKPGSSGQVTVSELKSYLSKKDQWIMFSQLTNVVLINIVGGSFPMATNKEYLDEWYQLPSLIGVEQIYKTYDDELLTPKAEFGNKSIIQYTQDKGLRTGVFHPIPTNVYGAPGGRGNYFNPKNYGTLNDLRGCLEFLFNVNSNAAPGIIVTDRPEVDANFLKSFGIFSKYTTRDGNY